ncbi:phytoene/squalene synthase family protein [Sporosarcina sp. PTS2304]|uniref:squalene/phytoene synthase family protein n=1 Tax=Sporosarcina sp. PTS2304 TaxID=2283194 RepID=UPI000E0D4E74|nr:phytoene/squalene synthase family protein [Sporosarcina sp. PTS2304]AXH99126.1 phytoene/squalene synthase family protein [Sporosarcina sp. PTS2304]
MKTEAILKKEAMKVLKETSRTFYIPIKLLEPNVREAVASAYLCMRAIDEIEDHEQLDKVVVVSLLQQVSDLLDRKIETDEPIAEELAELFAPYRDQLPEVTLRLADWIDFCPDTVTDKVLESTAIMGRGMAEWAEKDWIVATREDLDDYTYYVAGLVGVMLADIWRWYDGTETDRDLAIGFGRGLQSVNILRNYKEDAVRDVNFFPNGWKLPEMFSYAEENLALADRYIEDIQTKTILNFCNIPLALAHGTLDALKEGREKMSRVEVVATVNKAMLKK